MKTYAMLVAAFIMAVATGLSLARVSMLERQLSEADRYIEAYSRDLVTQDYWMGRALTDRQHLIDLANAYKECRGQPI